MTNQEIYDAALRLVCETSDPNENPDYKDRAPYLISAICYRYAKIDETYRLVNGLDKQKLLSVNCFPLTTQFPLSDIFAPPVSTAVAGLLVLGENQQMSQRLSDMAETMISEIKRAIPYQNEKIQSPYTF